MQALQQDLHKNSLIFLHLILLFYLILFIMSDEHDSEIEFSAIFYNDQLVTGL